MKRVKHYLRRIGFMLGILLGLAILTIFASWITALIQEPHDNYASAKVNRKRSTEDAKPLSQLTAMERYALIYYAGAKASDQTKGDGTEKSLKTAVFTPGRSKNTPLDITPYKIKSDFVTYPGTGYFMGITPEDLSIIGVVGYTRKGDNVYYYALIGMDPDTSPIAQVSLKSIYQQYYLPVNSRKEIENLESRLRTKPTSNSYFQDKSSEQDSSSDDQSVEDSNSSDEDSSSNEDSSNSESSESSNNEDSPTHSASVLEKYIKNEFDPNMEVVSSNAPDPDPSEGGYDDFVVSVQVYEDRFASPRKTTTFAVGQNGKLYMEQPNNPTQMLDGGYTKAVEGY